MHACMCRGDHIRSLAPFPNLGVFAILAIYSLLPLLPSCTFFSPEVDKNEQFSVYVGRCLDRKGTTGKHVENGEIGKLAAWELQQVGE